jgi:hypothetical protein
MAPSEPESAKSGFASRLGNYGAALVAGAALVTAADTLYSKIKQSQIAADTIAELKQITARTPQPESPVQFRLRTSHGNGTPNPTEADLQNAVKRLAAGEEEFLILERSPKTDEYIQSILNKDGTFHVEYRSKVARHETSIVLFGCERGLTQGELLGALDDYLKDGDTWTNVCAWKRVIL